MQGEDDLRFLDGAGAARRRRFSARSARGDGGEAAGAAGESGKSRSLGRFFLGLGLGLGLGERRRRAERLGDVGDVGAGIVSLFCLKGREGAVGSDGGMGVVGVFPTHHCQQFSLHHVCRGCAHYPITVETTQRRQQRGIHPPTIATLRESYILIPLAI